ncbi:MAG: hypothetical protein ACJ76J_21505 [Thermoanaerobaculia bacterium]
MGSSEFLLRKELERWVHDLYPDRYAPLYSLISFTNMPYAESMRQDREQRTLVGRLRDSSPSSDPGKPCDKLREAVLFLGCFGNLHSFPEHIYAKRYRFDLTRKVCNISAKYVRIRRQFGRGALSAALNLGSGYDHQASLASDGPSRADLDRGSGAGIRAPFRSS